MTKIKRPNFIIGGVAAGGTSFLSTILVQHPEIYLPREMRPEPHYYYKSWEYKKGLDFYLSRWFAGVPDSALAIGERSSSYLFGGTSVAEKIAADFPKMRFIFTLRNPIERTWANYRYTVLQGLEDLSFKEALEKEGQRVDAQVGIWAEIQPHNYTGRGYYANQIKQYLDHFSRENIMLIKSELLSSQTDFELEKIYRFLDLSILSVEYQSAPNHTSVNVVDPKLQMELRNYFSCRFDNVIEAIRKEEHIESFIGNSKDREMIGLLESNLSPEKMPMPDSARSYLQNLFFEDIQSLQELVDFELSDWE